MSKAEERALEAYPKYWAKVVLYDGQTIEMEANERTREVFIQAYEQAEKDLGWISVNDRLPDTPEYVLTCIEVQGSPQNVGFHYYDKDAWWEGYMGKPDCAIDYWMPIPKLPKKCHDTNDM